MGNNMTGNTGKALRWRTVLYTGIAVIAGLAGCAKTSFKVAKEKYDQQYYGQAAQMFVDVAKKAKDKQMKNEANLMAAEAYRKNDQYDLALKYYDKVLAKDPKNSQAMKMRGIMLMYQSKYREALDQLNKYLEEVPADSLALKRKGDAEFALSLEKNRCQRFTVSNFKKANTKQNDFAPVISSKKDNVLIFASDREGGKNKKIDPNTLNNWVDLWYIKQDGKGAKAKWLTPVPMKESSTKFNEGGLTFDSKFATMYLTQCGGTNGKTQHCHIYELKKQGEDWAINDMVEFCKADSSHNYGHPTLSEDGTQMYFSSDREGGLGGFDIWVVSYSKRGKTWGDPVNLGPTINTSADEYWPSINPHNKKLYFSTNGRPGMGGTDIYIATPTDDITVWEDVENALPPLNSSGDDFGVTFNGNNPNHGFFTSNRGEKRFNDDIYEFDVKPLVITLSGTVTDCNTKETLPGATITITNDKDTVVKVFKADPLGQYNMVLAENTRYQITCKYPEKYYFEYEGSLKVDTRKMKCDSNFVRDFCLKNPLDSVIVLPIFYDLDKAYIRPDASKILDDFAKNVVKRYPSLAFELGSHTDCRAPHDYNVDLAQRRADSAVNYLVKYHKIDPKRLKAKGFGEENLINACACEGTDIVGYTPYISGKTQKAMVEKDAGGNVIRSWYADYAPNEIQTINGKRVVPCDEYQHQQNRRTTVTFDVNGVKSRVDLKVDPNNTNGGKAEDPKGTAGTGGTGTTPATGGYDITKDSLAKKTRVYVKGKDTMLSAMVNDIENVEFAIDLKGRYTAVPPEVAAQWFTSKLINKGSFTEGEKLKAGDVKLPSNKFVVDKLLIGDQVFESVAFSITDKVEKPTLGKSAFKGAKVVQKVGDALYIIPKKAPRNK